ncbi:MAG: DUF4893 domain-containing protein [Sphingomonas sp.]
MTALAGLAGCAHHPRLNTITQPPPLPGPKGVVTIDPPPSAAWRGIASTGDQLLIDALPERWQAALKVVARRYPTRLKAEGALLDPAAALPLPALTPGSYWCRSIRLGGSIGYATTRPNRCEVAGDDKRQSLTKQDGVSLPGGWLYRDDQPKRLVFLGAVRLRERDAAPGYGAVKGRDVTGVVERVAPFRWRFVITSPASRAGQLELYEILPVPVTAPASAAAVKPKRPI